MAKQFTYATSVEPTWIDHNGHMNVAYFVLAFDEATDAVYEHWGVGLDYPEISGCSVFTLGMNVDYASELFAGDSIRVVTTLVDYDQKRIHYVHEMFNEQTSEFAASNECLCMNVALESRKSTPFSEYVLERLETSVDRDAKLRQFGRTLAIRHSAKL